MVVVWILHERTISQVEFCIPCYVCPAPWNWSKSLYFWTRTADCRLLNIHTAPIVRRKDRLHDLYAALHHEQAPQKGKVRVIRAGIHHVLETLVILQETLAEAVGKALAILILMRDEPVRFDQPSSSIPQTQDSNNQWFEIECMTATAITTPMLIQARVLVVYKVYINLM